MPFIPKWYAYQPLPYYPHMGPNDGSLWNNFVIKNRDRFVRCIYDMRCGTIETIPPGTPKNIMDAWQDLGRWRVDVVAEDKDFIYTVECRPRAQSDAIGHAIGYKTLFERDHQIDKIIKPLVITDYILPNTKIVADEYNVLIWTP